MLVIAECKATVFYSKVGAEAKDKVRLRRQPKKFSFGRLRKRQRDQEPNRSNKLERV